MKRGDVLESVLGDNFDEHEGYSALVDFIDEVESRVDEIRFNLEKFCDSDVVSSNEVDTALDVAKNLSDDLY